jgi:hypothetical protein
MSLFVDVIQGGSASHPTTSEAANYFATDFVAAGVVGTIGNSGGVGPCTGGLGVSAQVSPNNTVQINAGQIYVLATPTGQGSQMLRVRNTATINQTISANISGVTKYDWIYVSIDPTNSAQPDAGADNVATIVVSRSSSNTADNGMPPAYGTLIAVVTAANGFSTLANATISDRRSQTTLSTGSAVQSGWQPISSTLSYNANNGNKFFVLNSSVDLRSTLSVGMLLRLGRGVSPPTQCMAVASASSQYATKAAPTGISFTAAFTCEAWVYPISYTTAAGIISRSDNTTGGFLLQINSNGQAQIAYNGASAFTQWQTVQSVPLNRWTHIAGAVSSVAGKTLGGLYINGLSVPTTQPLSAATTLTQTGNLSIGAVGAGLASSFFNGYISEARVWSVAQSQASIQANMGINLVGNETSLVALFQGNGNFNDATSNANNLTATNGAIATQANNPYNALEYAIITAITSSTITVFTGAGYSVPNMALLSPNYAVAEVPYAAPVDTNFVLTTYDINSAATLLAAGINNPADDIQYANTGNAGGSMRISQVGKTITLRGETAALSLSASAQTIATISYPFTFNSLPTGVVSKANGTGTIVMMVAMNSDPTLTQVVVELTSNTGTTTGTAKVMFHIVGS